MADQPTLTCMHHSQHQHQQGGLTTAPHTPSVCCAWPPPATQNEVEASVQDFDRALALQPQLRPYLWQRGLSLYYLRDFQEAATQFRWGGRLLTDHCATSCRPDPRLN